MKDIRWALVLSGLTLAMFVQAQEDAFRRANLLYDKEVFDGALTVYDSLISAGESSFGLWYNYAMTNLSLKKHGPAIYGFEKARMLQSTEDLEYHLKLSQGMIIDPIPEFSEFFLVQWWRSLVLGVGSNTWAILALFLGVSGLCVLLLGWSGRLAIERVGWLSGFLLGMGLLAVLLSSAGIKMKDRHNPAIVMTESVALHEGSDERSPELRLVSEGIKVMLIDSIGDWYKIRLPDKDEGWTMSIHVRPL